MREPLQERVARVVDEIDDLKAVFYPLRVELSSGRIEIQTTLDRAMMDVVSSASIPIFAEPVQADGTLWVDGGTRDVSPIGAVVKRHNIDELYVLNTQSTDPTEGESVDNFAGVVQQTIDIMTTEIFRNDLRAFTDWNSVAKQAEAQGATIEHPRHDRDVEYVDATIIEPASGLPSGTTFSRAAMQRGIQAGRDAARKALS